MTAFKQFDNDGDGLIDEKEFAHFVVGVLGLKLKKPVRCNFLGRYLSLLQSAASAESATAVAFTVSSISHSIPPFAALPPFTLAHRPDPP